MSRDLAIPDQAPARARPRAATNLTQRASLNVVASLLDYGAKIAVNFLVIPILVTGLGRSLYGVWEMLGRLVGYLTAGDGRPTQALRLVVATMQASDDDAAKRRYVGAAFVVWILFLPVILAAGAVLVWAAPTITKAPLELQAPVRLGVALLVGGLLFANLASLPESVLRDEPRVQAHGPPGRARDRGRRADGGRDCGRARDRGCRGFPDRVRGAARRHVLDRGEKIRS